MNITIGHLYPDLLNLYGDRGNILFPGKAGRLEEACLHFARHPGSGSAPRERFPAR